MNKNGLANAGIVTQLAMVHTMLPKIKELIDDQMDEIETLKRQINILKKDVENWMDNAGQHPDEEYWERLLK